MMDVNDVRLGNLIIWNPRLTNPQITLQPMFVEIAVIAQDKIGYTPYKLEQRVEPFEDDRMVQMETQIKPKEEFEPIALTVERLEKTGFTNVNGNYQLQGFAPQFVSKGNFWNAIPGPDVKCIEVKYLHQLQNLYYSLVGEELEIIL